MGKSFCSITTKDDINLFKEFKEKNPKDDQITSPKILKAYINSWKADHNQILGNPSFIDIMLYKEGLNYIKNNSTGTLDKELKSKLEEDPTNYQANLYFNVKKAYKKGLKTIFCSKEELNSLGTNNNYQINSNTNTIELRLQENVKDLETINKALIEGYAKSALFDPDNDYIETAFIDNGILFQYSNSSNSNEDLEFFNSIQKAYKQYLNLPDNLKLNSINTKLDFLKEILANSNYRKLLLNNKNSDLINLVDKANVKYLESIKKTGMPINTDFEIINSINKVGLPTTFDYLNYEKSEWNYGKNDNNGLNNKKDCIQSMAQLFMKLVTKLSNQNNCTIPEVINKYGYYSLCSLLKDSIINDINTAINYSNNSNISNNIKNELGKRGFFLYKIFTNYRCIMQDVIPVLKDIAGLEILTNNEEAIINNTISEIEEDFDEQDNDNDDNTEAENDDGELGNQYIDTATQSTFSQLSPEIKKIIYNIPEVTINFSYDDETHVSKKTIAVKKNILGQNKMLDGAFIHNYLLKYLSPKLITSKDLMPALKELSDEYAAIKALYDTLNNDKKLQAKFYQFYNKDQINYLKVNGTLSTPINNTIYSNNFRDFKETASSGKVLTDNSIYNNDKTINKNNLEKLKVNLTNLLKELKKEFNNIDYQSPEHIIKIDEYILGKHLNEITDMLRSTGFDLDKDYIKTSFLTHIETVKYNLEHQHFENYSLFKTIENYLNNDILNKLSNTEESNYEVALNHFSKLGALKTLSMALDNIYKEDRELRAVYNHNAYNTSLDHSFLGGLIKQLNNSNAIKDEQGRTTLQQFLDLAKTCSFFTNFKNGKNELIRGSWLDMLDKNPKLNKLIGRTQVLANNEKPYEQWNQADFMTLYFNQFYYSITDMDNLSDSTTNSKTNQYDRARFPLPVPSDMAKCILVDFVGIMPKKHQTIDDVIEGSLVPRLREIVKQEIKRIKETEEMENNPNSPQIKTYKDRGKQFCFFPELNRVSKKTGKTFLETYDQLIEQNDNIGALNLIDNTIRTIVNNYAKEYVKFFQKNDLYKYNEIEGTLSKSPNLKISGDYNEGIEQIRLFAYNMAFATAQIYQLTTTDIAFYKDVPTVIKRFKETIAPFKPFYALGKTQNFIIVKDLEIASNQLKDIHNALQYDVENKIITKDQASVIESYYTKDKTHDGINCTDAQSYRSIESYKKMLEMLGNTEEKDEVSQAIDDILNGKFTYAKYKKVFQVFKLFSYSVNYMDNGLENPNGEANKLAVPLQIKNSEIALLMSRLLVSAYYNNKNDKNSKIKLGKLAAIEDWMSKHNVDNFVFQSAVKVGELNTIDLNTNLDDDLTKEGYEQTINLLETAYQNNPNCIHNISFEATGISMPTPNEWQDTVINMGVQFIREACSNLEKNATFTFEGKTYSSEEIYNEFMNLLKENLVARYKELDRILKNPTEFSKRILIDQTNSKTDPILKLASIILQDKTTGEFKPVIPFYDPFTADKRLSCLNNLIKKYITKQQVTGGTCYQLSAYGTGKDLNIRFKNKNNILVFNEAEFNEEEKCNPDYNKQLKEIQQKYKTFEEYSNSEDAKSATLAYWECAVPIYSEQLTKYYNEDGSFNIDKLPNELRYMLGYRIPTEDNHSMAPLYIKRVLPMEMGSSIIFPYDVTSINGSDFDIDKAFIQRPAFTFKNGIPTKITDRTTIKGRDNALLDITFSVLTHPSKVAQMFNPSGYAHLKHSSLVMQIMNYSLALKNKIITDFYKKGIDLNNISYIEIYDKINAIPSKELAAIIEKQDALIAPLKLTESIKAQKELTDGKLNLAILANINSAIRFLQHTNVALTTPIKFIDNNGKIYNITELNKVYDLEGKTLITDMISEALAAAPDTAKDPVLGKLNINKFTLPVVSLLYTLGLDNDTVLLLINQPIIKYFSEEVLKSKASIKTLLPILKRNLNESFTLTNENDRTINTKVLKEGLGETIDNINQGYIGKMFLDIYTDATEFNEILIKTKKDRRFDKNSRTIYQMFAKSISLAELINKINHPTEKYTSRLTNINSLINLNQLDLNDIKNMSYVQAFFATEMSALSSIKQYFPFMSNSNFIKIFQELADPNKDNINNYSKQIHSIVKGFTIYSLSSLDLFKHENRVKVLEEVPVKIDNLINKARQNHDQTILNNEFIKALTLVKDENGKCITLGINNNIDKNKVELSTAWSLLFNTHPQEALDLFIYNYYKYGTDNFNKNSLSMFTPINLLLNIPNYLNTLNNLDLSIENLERFKQQYLINNSSKDINEINLQSPNTNFLNHIHITKNVLTIEHNPENESNNNILTRLENYSKCNIITTIENKNTKYYLKNKSISTSTEDKYILIDQNQLNEFTGYDCTKDLIAIPSYEDLNQETDEEVFTSLTEAWAAIKDKTISKLKKDNVNVNNLDFQDLVDNNINLKPINLVTENKENYC